MKDFKKYYIIPATPDMVYAALTHEGSIQLWTGDKAIMSTEIGSEFSLWDGSITGKNLAFIPNHKIEQEWYFGETDLPSIVTIKLHEQKGKTSMEVRQTNIPDSDFDDIVDGWDNQYIESLIEFYTENE